MSCKSKSGPPKHQNKYAWKPHAGVKINETEVGGRFRPLSEITGVCPRCKDQIDWKRKYGKYKPLVEPAKCQKCGKRAVRQAYHNLCTGCAKEHKVCAKCCCSVAKIVGRDITEVEAERKDLEEAIKHARERERRTLLRAMNGKKNGKEEATPKICDRSREGNIFPATSIDEHVEHARKYFVKDEERDRIEHPEQGNQTDLKDDDDDQLDDSYTKLAIQSDDEEDDVLAQSDNEEEEDDLDPK